MIHIFFWVELGRIIYLSRFFEVGPPYSGKKRTVVNRHWFQNLFFMRFWGNVFTSTTTVIKNHPL